MSSLNVFIDGSWLFRACGAEMILSSKTEFVTAHVPRWANASWQLRSSAFPRRSKTGLVKTRILHHSTSTGSERMSMHAALLPTRPLLQATAVTLYTHQSCACTSLGS